MSNEFAQLVTSGWLLLYISHFPFLPLSFKGEQIFYPVESKVISTNLLLVEFVFNSSLKTLPCKNPLLDRILEDLWKSLHVCQACKQKGRPWKQEKKERKKIYGGIIAVYQASVNN